jgi:dihydroflavonol-4-reductase
MIVAVTGASGHIGINLLPRLIEKGYQVRVLVHKNAKAFEGYNVTPVQGDILNKDSLIECIDGAEVVIHLAGKVTIDKKCEEALKVNVEGTRNLLEASMELSVKKFIFFSSITSMSVFPLNEVFDENRELDLENHFDYDRSKALAEQLVIEAANRGLQTIILNPTAVIGPNDHVPSRLGKAVIQYYKGKIPALLDTGYDFVDVRDVAQATLGAIEVNGKGQRYILSGNWESLREFGNAIHRHGGKKPPRVKVPFWLARFGADFLNYFTTGNGEDKLFTKASLETLEHSHKNISNKSAVKDLNFKPMNFYQTIGDTVDWFKLNNYIS